MNDSQWLIHYYEEKPSIQNRLCQGIYKQFEMFDFFENIERKRFKFTHWLYQHLKACTPHEDYLFKEETKVAHMWFVMKGDLEYTLNGKN